LMRSLTRPVSTSWPSASRVPRSPRAKPPPRQKRRGVRRRVVEIPRKDMGTPRHDFADPARRQESVVRIDHRQFSTEWRPDASWSGGSWRERGEGEVGGLGHPVEIAHRRAQARGGRGGQPRGEWGPGVTGMRRDGGTSAAVAANSPPSAGIDLRHSLRWGRESADMLDSLAAITANRAGPDWHDLTADSRRSHGRARPSRCPVSGISQQETGNVPDACRHAGGRIDPGAPWVRPCRCDRARNPSRVRTQASLRRSPRS
jgi:hypothetical protein